MTPTVYFGSARQARLDAKETLPAKLEIILEKLRLRERVKGELVVLKMHVGNNMIYSTIHPIFVRRVVQAIKDGGGKPFIADVDWDVAGAETRAYTTETVGCPIYPAGGLKDTHFVTKEKNYKNMKEWKVAGHQRCNLPCEFCACEGASLLRIRRCNEEPCARLHGGRNARCDPRCASLRPLLVH